MTYGLNENVAHSQWEIHDMLFKAGEHHPLSIYLSFKIGKNLSDKKLKCCLSNTEILVE